MSDEIRHFIFWLAVAIGLATLANVLTGCATNGVQVDEITPDGGSFSMRQLTRSTIFARTEEGAGSVRYSGVSPDGSQFDLEAGAAVKGQDGGDPTALIQSLVELVKEITTVYAGARVRQGEIEADVFNNAIERIPTR